MINWWSWIQTEHQVVIRLSSVKIRGIHLNAVHTTSNAFQVSLKTSLEKMTGHLYNKKFWTEKR